MVRYCSCNRGIGYSNRTSVVRNSLGEEVCAHCGGIVPPEGPYTYDPYRYPDGVESENGGHDKPFDYYGQAKECSLKGDHSSAIKFYKEVLRQYGPVTNFEVLSFIADEYEAMGDYVSAEEYWMRCTSSENHDSYKYIAGKGDFLYRRECYEEAADAYEDALKILGDKNINLSHLKYYARVSHYIIMTYKVLGGNDFKEKYHSELKRAISRFLNSRRAKGDESNARYISQIACEIYEEDKMCDEAIILIDSAIKLHPTDDYYKMKATFIKYKLKISVIVKDITSHDLDLINEALRILPHDCDHALYLKVKSDILNLLGEFVKARICNALAYKHYDEVDIAEKQLEKLKKPGTYINITGIHYYQGFEPFSEGIIVDLIREHDNPHDLDAIRVEINGETVGYVANNEYTVIKEVKSATDIKNIRSRKAEVQFILFNKWVIAKLI